MNMISASACRPQFSVRSHWGSRIRSVGIGFAAILLLAPVLPAQLSDPPKTATADDAHRLPNLYTVKFEGGRIDAFLEELKVAFPKDNMVIAPAVRNLRLNVEPFEVRDASLKELGRTIEFLSDGRLSVEVEAGDSVRAGNFWRIGCPSSSAATIALKVTTRSVPAPLLFADKAKVERLIMDATAVEKRRIAAIVDAARIESSRTGSNHLQGVGETRIEPLQDQRIFVLVGDEEGIRGMESLVLAAEQLAAGEAARKSELAAALAPAMRAVHAPHLFASQDRLDRIIREFSGVQGLWDESRESLVNALGIDDRQSAVRIVPRHSQKAFVLIGPEAGMAGMESFILAAEKNASDEDAKARAVMAGEAEEKVRAESLPKSGETGGQDSRGPR